MCPTRWTVNGDTLVSFCNNHDELMELWAWSTATLKDTERWRRECKFCKLRWKPLKNFSVLFLVRKYSNKQITWVGLSRIQIYLQLKGTTFAQTVIKCLTKCRVEENLTTFFSFVRKRVEHLDVDEPELPRIKKTPKRMESYFGHCPTLDHQHSSVED